MQPVISTDVDAEVDWEHFYTRKRAPACASFLSAAGGTAADAVC